MLSGKYNDGQLPEGSRFSGYLNAGERQKAMAQRFVNEKSLAATKAFMEIAADEGVSPVTLAVAWSKQHDFVASTIVGATKADQMKEIIEAGPMKISAETNRRIDQVSKEIMYPMG